MLSVYVHKDISEYQEKVVGKLSFRTLICVIGGLGSSVLAACFTYFVIGIDVSNATFLVMTCSLPFWLLGFFHPAGMNPEQFMPLFIQHIFTDDKILYVSSVDLANKSLRDSIPQKQLLKDAKLAKRRGAELHEPTNFKQNKA